MKVGIVVAVGMLTASPFAILALDAMGVGPAFEAVPPEWEAGYTWTWDVTGRGRAVGEGFGVVRVETENLRVDATRQAEVLNTTLEENGVPYDLVLEAFRVDQMRYGDEVVYDAEKEAADDAPMDGGMFSQTFFCLTVCQTVLAPYTEDGNPYLGSAALDEVGTDHVRLLDFPLTRGKEWSVVNVEEEDFRFEIRATAVDNEYLDLDGFAPMQTVRIEAGLTEATKSAIKQLAKHEAKAEGIDIDLDFDIVLTYWYSPELQNIVKLDLDGFLAGRGTGYGAAGAGRVDFHLDQVLTEASLVPTRERSLDEATALAEATWASGGEPQQTSQESWPFTVAGSTLSVDADAAETVRFGLLPGSDRTEISTTDFTAPPAGVRTEWTHRWTTAEGAQTETASGDDAAFTIDAPGRHVITAQTVDADGRVMGADSILVEAYTRRTFQLDDPVGASGVSADHTEAFYVAPAAAEINVRFAAEGHTDGRFLLQTPNDMFQEPVSLTRGSDRLSFTAAPGDHELTWIDDVRVGSFEGTVEVRYPVDQGVVTVGSLETGRASPWDLSRLFDLL